MALIIDYSTLKTALEGYLNRTDITAYEDILIQGAEKWIYRNVRCRQMETALAVTISASLTGVAVIPSNYIELKSAYLDGSTTQVLQRKNPEYIYLNYPMRSSDDQPKFVAREGANFIFGPYPDSAYVMKGIYYQRFPAISSTTTNGLISDHPDLWLFASLCEADTFLENDERVPLWKSKRDEIARDINEEEKKVNYSGSALSVSPG